MPPSIDYPPFARGASARLRTSPGTEPVEFSIEDALLNTWVDESSVYLRLETDEEEIPAES